ncbi:Protein LTV1-like protein [Frankliniella fusca]|uniref:Protein LTV1 homolog n=1 Tax=Frankliniella fusca TaxID=407009 RepID=A0AAE1GTM9_9NEOP|nr:Protein LTV1-like protein [Frankliniella fusca]
MPKGKKKFIDKKNAVTFHLVHRSQHDPLTADEKAPQHVLVAAPEKKKKKNEEEEHKFGIFYDDDYDYLQHLRDTSKQSVHWIPVETGNNSNTRILKKKGKEKEDGDEESSDEEVYIVEKPKQLNLPSSVFASEIEEEVGLLNKAAPQSGLRLDLDPDIVAAMDEDFNFDDPDNELEDNFMELANASGDDDNDDKSINSDFNMSDEDFDEEASDVDSESRDELGSLGRPCQFEDEETRSRFTEYSMSSSVMRRNQQLSLLDHRFEKIFEEYDDNEIGALDCEEIEGYVPATSELLLQCAAEFGREKLPKDDPNEVEKPNIDTICSSESEDDFRDIELKGSDDDEKWDCQSILSTYSNIYNRPKLISERNSNTGKIRISKKTGMPIGVFESGSEKLTMKALAKLDAEQGSGSAATNAAGRAESVISTLSTLSIRPKDETPEERKQRKKMLKEYRRERIAERKANTAAFKEEKKRQEKIILNNKKNIPTTHIL